MSPDQFRRDALALPEAIESAHMGRPDFRVRKKIFATLGTAGNDLDVLNFTLEQQELFVRVDPAAFAPIPGGWGRKGWTQLRLVAANPALVGGALAVAWRNVGPKKLAAALDAAAATF
ncbi:MAG: MmcQ/YjbR family DNA-binding protein [Dokdonella sp.]